MSGFLFLDEPEKHLDSPETLKQMIEFIQEIQKDTKRQIFWITHKDEVVASVFNPIILKTTVSNLASTSIESDTTVQKRKKGRPRKNG
jgi:ABC-type multidrug transport system ATPase subunit